MTTPAWDTISTDVNCPLCEYNLRGLVEPRCPECGHRFEWSELLEAKRNEHPFLIEHARSKLFASYWKTFRTSVGVRGLWPTLSPVNRLGVRRLVAYKLSQLVMFVAGLLLVFGLTVAWQVGERAHNRAEFIRYNSGPRVSQRDLQSLLDRSCPWLSVPQYVQEAWADFASEPEPLIILLVFLIGWPWVLVVAQRVFLESLRRRHIHRGHLLRCAVYSSDAAVFWFVPYVLAFAIISIRHFFERDARYMGNDPMQLGLAMRFSLLPMLLWLTWRLVQAYRRYLRFNQATASAISAAIITSLVLMLIMDIFIRQFWFRLGLF